MLEVVDLQTYQLVKKESQPVNRRKLPAVETLLIDRSTKGQTLSRTPRTQSKNTNRLLDRIEKDFGVHITMTGNSRVKLELPGKQPVFVAATPHAKSATHKVRNDIRKILGLDV